MEYVIRTENLVKQYNTKKAVNQVSLHIKKGEIYGLIGKNGAGKTTFMKMILGLSAADSGKIFLFENDDLNKERVKFGSLIEEPGLYKNCSARENLHRFSILYGADKSEVDKLLRIVRLSNTGKKPVGQFSLGMKQRLGIAIALLNHPEVLVLDEPVNGLDPEGIKDVRNIILKLNQQYGVTFFISSHLLDELAKVVTCYGIMRNGRLVEEISAEELNKKCGHTIQIKCSDAIKAMQVLQEYDSNLHCEIHEDTLSIYSQLNNVAQINTILVKNNIEITEINQSSDDLEKFFIERMGK